MAYSKLLFHTPWILRFLTRRPSFLMPTFSKTRADAGFSGRHVAQILWRRSSPNPRSNRCFAASVAIPLPQDYGSTRYQISPSSAPLKMTTPQSPTRSLRGLSLMARTMDRQGSDGDSRSESRRNFSLSSLAYKENRMWRTTSILEIKAWTASTSPNFKLRRQAIANSIGTAAGHNRQPGSTARPDTTLITVSRQKCLTRFRKSMNIPCGSFVAGPSNFSGRTSSRRNIRSRRPSGLERMVC